MIEATSLSRRYGDFTAVRDISFSIDEGEIVGILGPNGAGKTTTIRMITGFLPPSAGRVMLNGQDLFREPDRVRRQIGYLPENVALYPEMRVAEYLRYRARLEGMDRRQAAPAIGQTLERCLLTDVEGQIIRTLSKGFRQRVGLAAAILHQPKVLVLDEPTVGLDPKQIIAIRELIRELGKRQTLLLSTHILPEVEQLCDRVLIIDRGRLVAEGTPEKLRQELQGESALYVTVQDGPEEAAAIFAELTGVTTVEAPGGERFILRCLPDADLREAVFKTAVAHGWVLLELREERVSLEDIFVRMTSPAEAPEDDDAQSGIAEDRADNGEPAQREESAAKPTDPGEEGS